MCACTEIFCCNKRVSPVAFAKIELYKSVRLYRYCVRLYRYSVFLPVLPVRLYRNDFFEVSCFCRSQPARTLAAIENPRPSQPDEAPHTTRAMPRLTQSLTRSQILDLQMYIVDGGLSARAAAAFFDLPYRPVQRFAVWLEAQERRVNRSELAPGRFACKRCLRVLETPAFAADARKPCGHRYTCKECYNAGRSLKNAHRSALALQQEEYTEEDAEHEVWFGAWLQGVREVEDDVEWPD
jgi:hypothetical protein